MGLTTMTPTLTQGGHSGVFPVGTDTSGSVSIWPPDANSTPSTSAVSMSTSAAVDDLSDSTTSASVYTSGHDVLKDVLKDVLQKNLSDVVTALRLTSSSMPRTSADDISASDGSGTDAAWYPDEPGHVVGSTALTYEADDAYSLHIEASKRLWELVRQDETVVLVVFLSIVTCLGIVAVVVSKIVLRRRHQYQLIPNQDPAHRFNYIYRPIHGNAALDDEYENTFVGVSIPILQDNTRI